MNLKNVSVLVLGCLLLGAAFGYYLSPTKTVVKTEIKEVIKEVERKEKDTKKDTKKDKIIIKVETILPDGTRRIETKIVDKGTITIDMSESSEKETDKSKESKEEKIVESQRNGLQLYGLAGVNVSDLSSSPEYGLGISKRLLGPIWIGGQGTNKGNVGITLGIGF